MNRVIPTSAAATKKKELPQMKTWNEITHFAGFGWAKDHHDILVLVGTGQIVREGALPNTRPALVKLLTEFPRATVALEAGTHSPWISRYLTELGATVVVANPPPA
ncbi:MAG: hypothetical protein WBS33_16430 [Verrucomicrobiia bacterium]